MIIVSSSFVAIGIVTRALHICSNTDSNKLVIFSGTGKL